MDASQLYNILTKLNPVSDKNAISTLIAANKSIINDLVESATILHQFAETNNLGMVELLVEGGANVNSRSRSGRTPLHWALSRKQNANGHYLLKHGADINAAGDDGDTVLHEAQTLGAKDVIELLLKYNPDTSIRNKSGYTALNRAKLIYPTGAKLIEDHIAKSSKQPETKHDAQTQPIETKLPANEPLKPTETKPPAQTSENKPDLTLRMLKIAWSKLRPNQRYAATKTLSADDMHALKLMLGEEF